MCRCVGGRTYATRRVKFDCAPGTVFDPQLGICIFSSKSECNSEGVAPPGPPPNTIPSPVGPTGTIACLEYQVKHSTAFLHRDQIHPQSSITSFYFLPTKMYHLQIPLPPQTGPYLSLSAFNLNLLP